METETNLLRFKDKERNDISTGHNSGLAQAGLQEINQIYNNI